MLIGMCAVYLNKHIYTQRVICTQQDKEFNKLYIGLGFHVMLNMIIQRQNSWLLKAEDLSIFVVTHIPYVNFITVVIITCFYVKK
jgi:hypothetical protein